MPLSFASSMNDTRHNIPSYTDSEVGGHVLPNNVEDTQRKDSDKENHDAGSAPASHWDELNVTTTCNSDSSCASWSGDLSSQSSEIHNSGTSPINRSKLHFGFPSRTLVFTSRKAGTKTMSEVGFPTSIYDYDQTHHSLFRGCFEEDEEILLLVFEDIKRDRLVIASFVRYYLDMGKNSAELLFFTRKGKVVTDVPESLSLHFIDYLRCSRSLIDCGSKPGRRRLMRLCKRDVRSCLIHDKMSQKRKKRKIKTSLTPKRRNQIQSSPEDLKDDSGFAWLSESDFRTIFGCSTKTLKEVVEEVKTF